MPKREVVRFGKWGKLSPRCIEPFEVLKRVGTFAYRLALLSSLSSVHAVFHVSMLRKYSLDPTHVVDWARLLLMWMGPLRRDQYISWIAESRFFDGKL